MQCGHQLAKKTSIVARAPPSVLNPANAAMAMMATAVNPARTSIMVLFSPDGAFLLLDPLPGTVIRATENLLKLLGNAPSVRYYTRFDKERPKRIFGGVGLSAGLLRLHLALAPVGSFSVDALLRRGR